MKVKVYLILISFVLALPLMGQTAAEKALSDLTPHTAAQVVEMTLGYEGHPTKVKIVKTSAGWNFEIDLKKQYTTLSMTKFLGTMVGAIATATRHTKWKSNRVYMKTAGIKFAWITTTACRKLMRKMERGEYNSQTLLKAVSKEIHMLI